VPCRALRPGWCCKRARGSDLSPWRSFHQYNDASFRHCHFYRYCLRVSYLELLRLVLVLCVVVSRRGIRCTALGYLMGRSVFQWHLHWSVWTERSHIVSPSARRDLNALLSFLPIPSSSNRTPAAECYCASSTMERLVLFRSKRDWHGEWYRCNGVSVRCRVAVMN